MIRCAPALAALAFATLASLAAGPAAAQVTRGFPANALRGQITFGIAPDLTLNGRPARLAPGARIRGVDNMLQMSATLTRTRWVVDYTLESTGLVYDVWLLSDTEIARAPWPVTAEQAARWSFDVVNQTWTAR